MAALYKEFEQHASWVIEWMRQLVQGAADVFASGGQATAPVDFASLHAKIGELALENDLFERALSKAGLLSPKS